MATVTLGTKMDMKEMDEVLVSGQPTVCPPITISLHLATGEAKAQRGIGRREIGHIIWQ